MHAYLEQCSKNGLYTMENSKFVQKIGPFKTSKYVRIWIKYSLLLSIQFLARLIQTFHIYISELAQLTKWLERQELVWTRQLQLDKIRFYSETQPHYLHLEENIRPKRVPGTGMNLLIIFHSFRIK